MATAPFCEPQESLLLGTIMCARVFDMLVSSHAGPPTLARVYGSSIVHVDVFLQSASAGATSDQCSGISGPRGWLSPECQGPVCRLTPYAQGSTFAGHIVQCPSTQCTGTKFEPLTELAPAQVSIIIATFTRKIAQCIRIHFCTVAANLVTTAM